MALIRDPMSTVDRQQASLVTMFRIRRAQPEPTPDSPEPTAAEPEGPTGDATRPQSAHNVRRALVLVAVGSLAAAAITLMTTGNLGKVTEGSSTPTAIPTHTGSAEGPAFADAQPGDCLTWTDPVEPDLTTADCAAEHLFEVSASVDLSVFPNSEFGTHAVLATPARYIELRDQVCVPATEQYLGGKLDPSGRFTVGLIHPSSKGWSQGERSIRCGLQETSVDGTVFHTISGTVASQDQSKVLQPGECRGIKGGVPTDPVDCGEEHAVEATAILNLAEQFPDGPPSAEQQDQFLQEACLAATEAFLGSPDALHNQTLTVLWGNLSLPSWQAGSRLVNCTVGSRSAAGDYAPIVGAARGQITIGGKAPAPAPQPPAGRAVPVPLPAPANPMIEEGPPPGTEPGA
ncbi:septum formation family protein [Tomitella biformata]|uniref:septum formation family protein n=1 Tax=Tomitella biformata TaxID=630403 RepID=UPI0004643B71|nr:septum formation family protein [Tomitella biformata]